MKLLKILKNKKMTVTRFCKILGIKTQTFYSWQNKTPNLILKLVRIAEVINIYDIRDLARIFEK